MELLEYFDLNRGALLAGPDIPTWQQLLLFAVVVVAVIASNGVANARRGEPITLNLSWPWVIIASVIALMVFPAAWDLISAKAAPLIVQAGFAAQAGAFWSILVTAAEKARSPVQST